MPRRDHGYCRHFDQPRDCEEKLTVTGYGFIKDGVVEWVYIDEIVDAEVVDE